MTTTVAVLAAQREELAPLLRRAGARRDGGDGAATYWRGRIGGVELALAVTGAGRRRAAAGARALLERSRAGALAVVGVAGALSADLEVGAVTVARVVALEDGSAAAMDPGPVVAAAAAGALPAVVLTVDRVVVAREDRQRLLEAAVRADRGTGDGRDHLVPAGAGAGGVEPARYAAPAAVVDMETWYYAAAAGAAGLPAVVLRAVSDGAAEVLPEILARSRRHDGDLDRRRIALHAVLHPGAVPTLLELRRRVARAAEGLDRTLPLVLPALAAL